MTLTLASSFWNGTFYRRVSPTSFYPLLLGNLSDHVVDAIVHHWLLNRSRFCLSEHFPSEQTKDCYWGLPSISADDPAFEDLGYWRGYVWGPMSMLVYWSLEEYDHVPSARIARNALEKQMNNLMLRWGTLQVLSLFRASETA